MGRQSGRGAALAPRAWSVRARLAASALALALLPVAGVLAPQPGPADAAVAVDYPSWDELQEAKRNTASAKAAVERIRGLIAQLEQQVAAAEQVAQEKGAEFAEAQTAYDEQAYATQQLEEKVAAAQAEADAAKRSAGQLIAGLYRGSGNDVATRLFSGDGDPDALLYQLSSSQRFSSSNSAVYERAVQLQNSAQALADQAEVERGILDELRVAAETAFQEAQEAAIAAQAAYDEQVARQAELEQQLAYLTDQQAQVQAAYDEGVRARAAGSVGPFGWANPSQGCITSHFGSRYHPIYGYWKLHSGTDIGCGGYNAPIYAAASGTVVYAGWYSDLGYFIRIDHGDGIVTGYGHINYGGLLVRTGEHVEAGQQIAKVGSTGGSTGPHLHYMVYRSGVLTDPVPFMRDRGVTLG